MKNIKLLFESGGGQLCGLLARYCLNVEDKVAAKFYNLFSEQYKSQVKREVEDRGQETEGVVMGILLEMFARFKHEI